MSLRSVLAALLVAGAAAAACPAWSQAGSKHEVRRGETLFAIARKEKHEGVSRNQMILAIWRANPGAFAGGNINLLEIGTVLAVPSRETVAAIDPADADREVHDLLAKWSGAPVASARPATVAPKAPETVPPVPLGQAQAARRYREGLDLEHKRDDKGAFKAFLESAEAGYGLAQRRLGEIYDKGNSAVARDYQASLRWYQKAREQGIEIDKPLPRITAPVK